MTRQETIELTNNIKTAEDTAKVHEYVTDPKNIDPSKETIAWCVVSKTGTSWARLETPLFSFLRNSDEFNHVYCDNGIKPWIYNISSLIVDHRASDPSDFFLNVKKYSPLDLNRPVWVADADDNESILSKKHPLYWIWNSQGRNKQSIRAITECDLFETTTRKLRDYGLKYNKNVQIFRNEFNWRLPGWNLQKKRRLEEFVPIDEATKKAFDFPEEWQNKIVITYFGLTSHMEDLIKMAPIITKIIHDFPNTVFIFGGVALKDSQFTIEKDPQTGKDIVKEQEIVNPEDRYRRRVERLFEGIPSDRLRIYDALPLEQYSWFYSLSDINLALVEHNIFNQCKSEIKILEGFRYEAMNIYSDFGGYSDFNYMLEKELGISRTTIDKMTCRTECEFKEWYEKIAYWIENYDTEERKALTSKIKDFVTQKYDVDLHIGERISLYKKLIEENIEKEYTRIYQMNTELIN